MERREQVTRIIEAIYFKGDSPGKNADNVRAMMTLADELAFEAPPVQSAGARLEPNRTDKLRR